MTTQDYNRCVDAHADGVYRFILHNTRDKEFSEDIVQDAFEKMWVNVENIQAEKAKSYLFTTAYHTMLDKLRRAKKQGNWNEVREESISHHQGHYSGLKQILREALDKLPGIQRTSSWINCFNCDTFIFCFLFYCEYVYKYGINKINLKFDFLIFDNIVTLYYVFLPRQHL